jgi:hypothetical protein
MHFRIKFDKNVAKIQLHLAPRNHKKSVSIYLVLFALDNYLKKIMRKNVSKALKTIRYFSLSILVY